MLVQNDTIVVPSACSDCALIAQTISGDEHAFAVLVQRYNLPLYNFIQRFLKEAEWTSDVLQFVFSAALYFTPKASAYLIFDAYKLTIEILAVPGGMEPLYGRIT